jgi:tetratricopeptide (TPR) repeat protein
MSEPQKDQDFFPKIYRFITERWKVLAITVVSLGIAAGIYSQGSFLLDNLKQYDLVQKERASLEGELSYWQQVVKEYGGYRDAYFRIASLQYQLGQIDEAEKSIEKVIGLDPNFENARVLGDKIKANK